MKLLIITQKVDKNDPILGFFHSWLLEFAKKCETVSIVCLYKGEYDLPENVRVFSLGKEERQSRLQYLIHFYWFIIHERKKYDTVFVHMNQIYVVMAGFLWRMWKMKVGLWYTHRARDWTLRVATLFATDIFTASKEGFSIPTPKLHIVGHGINVEQFSRPFHTDHDPLRILSVGRITRIKNLETLVEAAALLKKEGYVYNVVGPLVTPDDADYKKKIDQMIVEKGLAETFALLDPITNEKVVDCFAAHDININLAPTGGVDKVVIEGMAAGIIPLVSNKAFEPVFGPYAKDLIFETRNSQDLAQKLTQLIVRQDKESISKYLKGIVERDFSHKTLIQKIVTQLS